MFRFCQTTELLIIASLGEEGGDTDRIYDIKNIAIDLESHSFKKKQRVQAQFVLVS